MMVIVGKVTNFRDFLPWRLGIQIAAMLTEGSVKSLGLAKGSEAVAVVKTTWVTLLSGTPVVVFFKASHVLVGAPA